MSIYHNNKRHFCIIRVLGPLALVECEKNGCELPNHNRPVFNYSMKGVVAAFSGVRKRDELVKSNLV